MMDSNPLHNALSLPSGARFYKCALQINPYDYLKRHHKEIPYTDEKAYNEAMIQECKNQNIEVISITDHYCVSSAEGLWKDATDAGIYVFPGFEAVTKDGVHLLCIFNPDRSIDQLERILGDCGIHNGSKVSPAGKYDTLELMDEVKKWNALSIAAHVGTEGGLLKTLERQARTSAWTSPKLLACSIPGSVTDAPENIRQILLNQDPAYHRDHPVAILNVQDVNGPEDLKKNSASCWIKMSEVSIEGLRQAFLDPESRILLSSEKFPEKHFELSAIAWEGGFLDGQAIHLNNNLNVLIGGRGTGKSTIIESIRYALACNPLGEDAQKAYEGILKQVLKSGTKISLLISSFKPSKRTYRIERTIPNPPVVRDEHGKVLHLSPTDVIPKIEVYGQHEISELTRSPEKLTRLLDRFIEKDQDLIQKKVTINRELDKSRSKILDIRKEINRINEQLLVLPGIEETLKRFKEAKVEHRLKEQSLLVREERILKTAIERISPFQEILDSLLEELPIDRAFLSEEALKELPNKDILFGLDNLLNPMNNELELIAKNIKGVLNKFKFEILSINTNWQKKKEASRTAYEKILRDLQKSSVDGAEFLRLRKNIEELRPLKEKMVTLKKQFSDLEEHRKDLLVEWEDTNSAEFRQLERASKKVNRKLKSQVRVSVSYTGNREPLFNQLKEYIGGRLSETLDILSKRETLSLNELTNAIRSGGSILHEKYGIPLTQADRIASAPPEVIMQIEELELPSITKIELNIAGLDQIPVWQSLNDLSTGQKATAVLLLLLLESDAPLIVDQPEDDLDNRFITEGIVPRMREEKQRRQFILATHNANIPVLGDAELIIGLEATGEAELGHTEIATEHMGSIDSSKVREMVEEILEGGKEAFETRRLKYGF